MASKVDAVCLALTALWQAAVALDPVNVVDGPQVNAISEGEWLFVGYDADTLDETTDGAVGLQTFEAFLKTKFETGEVTCSAVVVRGDTDVPAARARAFAIVSAAEDSLRADLSLGGLAMQCWLSEQRFIPMQTNRGAKARVVFTVSYLAQL
jgi:hypothetical protein